MKKNIYSVKVKLGQFFFFILTISYSYKSKKEGKEMTNTKFNEVKAAHMEQLEQFTPIVERVHGDNHPEFYKVHQLFNRLNKN